MSGQSEVDEYYNFILPLVQEAGQYFLQSQFEKIVTENKTAHELVTKYDKNIENDLTNQIRTKYPQHKFIGEEGSELAANDPVLTNDPTWIIDPIDGTTNFSRKIPLSGISVGLTVNKEQVLGIVFIPYLNELYTATKGKGAYMNGETIHCNNVTDPKKSIFCYEISVASRSAHLRKLILTRLSHYIDEVFALRCFGCPILSLCYVASGKLDAYQCDGLYPWDAAAGTLIVAEAGGCVVESSGNNHCLMRVMKCGTDITNITRCLMQDYYCAGKEFNVMKSNFLATCTKELSEKYVGITKKADEEQLK